MSPIIPNTRGKTVASPKHLKSLFENIIMNSMQRPSETETLESTKTFSPVKASFVDRCFRFLYVILLLAPYLLPSLAASNTRTCRCLPKSKARPELELFVARQDSELIEACRKTETLLRGRFQSPKQESWLPKDTKGLLRKVDRVSWLFANALKKDGR